MKIDYLDFDTIEEFNLRWYVINEELAFPSITSMLGRTQSEETRLSLENWRNSIGEEAANAISLEATTNGTAVHLLIEMFLKGEAINEADFTDQQIKSFKSLKAYLKKIDEVWGQEVALFSADLRIAGRCDCIGVYKGKLSILDWKTSSKIKSEHMIEDYKYQLAFYARAHNEMYGTNIQHGVILMATKDGFPLEFCVDLNKYFDKLEARVKRFYEIIL
jgi:ATP-dependent exoDNAse (exonuclease V) beta subunit